jgi:hypothetical protein
MWLSIVHRWRRFAREIGSKKFIRRYSRGLGRRTAILRALQPLLKGLK